MTALRIETTISRVTLLRDIRSPHREPLPAGQSTLMPSSAQSDLALVQGCAERDPAALRELVQRHQAKMQRFLRDIVGSPEDAEEAAQDVFLRVWQQANGFEARASVTNWLYRIAANVAFDLLRRRKALRRTMPPQGSTDSVTADAQAQALAGLEQDARAGLLQAALGTLRPDDRLVLTLYYAEEKNCEEICEIIRTSYPVLKMRLLRARRRLRSALEAMPGGTWNELSTF